VFLAGGGLQQFGDPAPHGGKSLGGDG
jgi:hypothetical protein